MSEVEVRQTVRSGSSETFFELLVDGELVASRTIDSEGELGRGLLELARRRIHEAQREAIVDLDRRAITVRGVSWAGDFASWRDRHAETQAMVRAFAGVVFPDAPLS